MKALLDNLFEEWASEPCRLQQSIGAHGSNRLYYRLIGEHHRCVAAVNDDVRENESFVYWARFFRGKALAVPEVYLFSPDKKCYLQEDLGDTTLYSYLYDRKRNGQGTDCEVLNLYKRAIDDLICFQCSGVDADFSMSYPRAAFDRQSMQWDLNYFKYYFLKLAHIPFDEQLLENDFQHLMDYLLDEPWQGFMYRDFQSRNIMLNEDGKLLYIDFQGGRKGSSQYDVASLIYSAKSDLSDAIRRELLDHYLDKFAPILEDAGMDVDAFHNRFYGFVLLRIMQAMGAYGYRGYYERKEQFLKSVPLAIRNLRSVVENHPLPVRLPHLENVWNAIIESPFGLEQREAPVSNRLTITINSFSYKQGLPSDPSGNGGGHVFDCRALPNPGRYAEYREYTGRDANVKAFLNAEPSVDVFLDNAQGIVFQSINKYLERHFSHLMVSFGCTGGQHRSVYCAEQMAERIQRAFDTEKCQIVLHHLEQEKKMK